MVIEPLALRNFKAHVLREYPKEACGVLVAGAFIPTKNIAVDPIRHFEIAASEIATISATVGRIEAILHSHPYDPHRPNKWPAIWPSRHDMEQWLQSDIPWGIVTTEGENVTDPVWLDEANPEPLIGREFIHGINDCYSLVRDWFRLERGITLPNYARGMEWWDKGLDLYSANFKDAGFEVIPSNIVQAGDCALIKIKAPVINHAGVVTGPNRLLHHLWDRPSRHDDLHKWERFCTFVRYKP